LSSSCTRLGAAGGSDGQLRDADEYKGLWFVGVRNRDTDVASADIYRDGLVTATPKAANSPGLDRCIIYIPPLLL
jgi:hypothetical protein